MKKTFTFFLILLDMLLFSCSLHAQISQYTLLGKYNIPNGERVMGVTLKGNTVYVPYYVNPNTARLDIIDVDDPANIILLGSLTFSVPSSYYTVPVNVVLRNNYLYISMFCGGFVIIDVTDVSNPSLVSYWSLPNPGWGDSLSGILVEGNYLYGGFDYNHGLGIFDISDLNHPFLVSNYGGISFARYVAKKGNYVFVSTYYGGYIRIFDVSNPASPVLVNNIYTPGVATYIGEISGDYYYIPDCRNTYGLKIYNVASPANPVFVSQFDTISLGFGWMTDLRVLGNRVIATFPQVPHVVSFDISDPSSPKVDSILTVGGNISGLLECTTDRIYLSGNDGALYIWGSLSSISTNADVLTYKYSTPQPRPGFDMIYTITYKNQGKINAKNVRVIDTLPANVTYVSSNPPYTSMPASDRLVWNLGKLAPNENGVIKLTVNVTAQTPLGTKLSNRCRIITSSKEDIKYNNSFITSSIVIGSYDPNDKEVLPTGFIKGDESLFYVIHYENEGTAEAINIKIEDTLDENLDDTTLSGISGNGVYNTETRTISWDMREINLPVGETDFVYFTIKAKQDLAPLTNIKNKALITFDFNEPMETPEVVTIIGTKEQLALQKVISGIINQTEEIETGIIDANLSNPEAYFDLIDNIVESAWLAFDEAYNSQLPWKDLNNCQSNLNILKDLIQSRSGLDIPVELATQWISAVENIIPGIISSYPPEPIANAGLDMSIEATGILTPVILSGNDSYDPNPSEQINSYIWYNEAGDIVATGINPELHLDLGLGIYKFTLVVSDGQNNSKIIDKGLQDDSVVQINVADATPPEVNAGADIEIEGNCIGGAKITLPVPVINDIVDPNPTIIISGNKDIYPIGTTIVEVKAIDFSGNCGTDEIAVTVKDTTPPKIEVNVSPNLLWPLNHEMKNITTTVNVVDICDPKPKIILESITSNEPDNGLGDGDTANDIQEAVYNTEDYTFMLRSERSGKGNGRLYTITYTVTDDSGNSASSTVNVIAPHDNK